MATECCCSPLQHEEPPSECSNSAGICSSLRLGKDEPTSRDVGLIIL